MIVFNIKELSIKDINNLSSKLGFTKLNSLDALKMEAKELNKQYKRISLIDFEKYSTKEIQELFITMNLGSSTELSREELIETIHGLIVPYATIELVKFWKKNWVELQKKSVNHLSDLETFVEEKEYSRFTVKQISDISVNGLDVVYGKEFKALDNVNFKIKQGEFVAFIGLSGAGKTTLINAIAGIIKPTNGDISVNGIVVNAKTKVSRKDRRVFERATSIITQSYNLIPATTVLSNTLLAFAPEFKFVDRLFGASKEWQKDAAYSALARVGILENANKKVEQLSGGQMQRVALSRAIAKRSPIILADEPVAALDPVTLQSVMKVFEELNKIDGATVITNLHHVEVALRYADRIIGIKEGKIVFNDLSLKVTPKVLQDIYGAKISISERDIEHVISAKKKAHAALGVLNQSVENKTVNTVKKIIGRKIPNGKENGLNAN